LGLVGKDALTEEEYLLLEAGNRNTGGIIARPFQIKLDSREEAARLGLARCDHIGKGLTITEKGLQAIGRGDAPPATKAPVQEQTPGIHVSGPMPPETFKLNPADLNGSLSNAATVGSGRITKVLHLYETVPFACVHVTNGVTPLMARQPLRAAPARPPCFLEGRHRDTPRPDGGLLGLVVTEPGGREYVMGNDTDRVTVVVSSPRFAGRVKVDDFADDGEIVPDSEEQVTTGAFLTIRVARTVGGRWLESHKAWTGDRECSSPLGGSSPVSRRRGRRGR
jgi:hypothetical protein